MEEKINRLSGFVLERFLFNKSETLDHEQPLFSNGTIDSFSVMELILEIETLFQIEFHIQYLIDDKVDTFSQLQKTVSRVVTELQAG